MSKGEVPTYELSVEDIQSIPDYETAKKYMKKWKIRTKGIKSKEEAILKLTEFWRARELASVFEEEESRNRSKIKKNKDTVGKRTEAVHGVPIEIRDGDGKLPLLEKKAQDVHQMAERFCSRSAEIQKIKDNVEGRKDGQYEVLKQIKDSNGKLSLLLEKAADLYRMSKQFKRMSFKASAKRIFCQEKSVIIITVFVILVVIAVVVTTTIIILEKGS